MEGANHTEANDSDYDPNKDTKKEVSPKVLALENYKYHSFLYLCLYLHAKL